MRWFVLASATSRALNAKETSDVLHEELVRVVYKPLVVCHLKAQVKQDTRRFDRVGIGTVSFLL